MRRLAWFLVMPLLLGGLVVPSQASAGGFSALDFGTRREGAFAVVGRPDDATAIFHNPAGLTLRSGTDLYMYAAVIVGDLAMKFYDSAGILRPDHEVNPDFNVGALPFLAVTTDLGTEDLRLALGLYAPNGFGASMPDNEPTRYHVTKALFIASSATFSAAYKFSDAFSIGLSASLVNTYLNAGRIMNPVVLTDPDERFKPVADTQSMDYDLNIEGMDWNLAWGVGLLLRPIPSLRLGASFSSGSDLLLEGDVRLESPTGEVTKSTHKTSMALPFTLRGGINWEPVSDFEIGLDITYWHYQVLQEQLSTLSSPILGIEEFRDPKDFGNSVLWCIGVTYHLTDALELMMGWQMDFTPTPTATYSIQSPSRDSKGIAVGARWQASEKVRLGAAFNRIWFDLVDIQDSQTLPPTNAKGHGGMLYFAGDVNISF